MTGRLSTHARMHTMRSEQETDTCARPGACCSIGSEHVAHAVHVLGFAWDVPAHRHSLWCRKSTKLASLARAHTRPPAACLHILWPPLARLPMAPPTQQSFELSSPSRYCQLGLLRTPCAGAPHPRTVCCGPPPCWLPGTLTMMLGLKLGGPWLCELRGRDSRSLTRALSRSSSCVRVLLRMFVRVCVRVFLGCAWVWGTAHACLRVCVCT